jgi:hypothetical protein
MFQRVGFQALKEAGEKARAAPVVYHTHSIALSMVDMCADDDHGRSASLQSANQLLLLDAFDRLLAQSLAIAPRRHKHIPEVRFALIVVPGNASKPALDNLPRKLCEANRLLLGKTGHRIPEQKG